MSNNNNNFCGLILKEYKSLLIQLIILKCKKIIFAHFKTLYTPLGGSIIWLIQRITSFFIKSITLALLEDTIEEEALADSVVVSVMVNAQPYR